MTTHEIIYLTRNMNESVFDMHQRVCGVCDLYVNSGAKIVNVSFQSSSLEVCIVLANEAALVPQKKETA